MLLLMKLGISQKLGVQKITNPGWGPSKLVLLLRDPSSRERGTAYSRMHSGFSEYGNGAEPSPGCFAKRNSNNRSKKLILMGI